MLKKIWCVLLLYGIYSVAAPHMLWLVPFAFVVGLLIVFPIDERLTPIRYIGFWALIVGAIHNIPASPDLYYATVPANQAMQPVMLLIGICVGYLRYLHVIGNKRAT